MRTLFDRLAAIAFALAAMLVPALAASVITPPMPTATPGSVPFAGSNGVYSQDNANLFWDAINHYMGIGTTSPNRKLTVRQSGADGEIASFESQSGNVSIIMKDLSGTKYNWRFGSQSIVDQGFEITPSSAAGTTTFMSPALVVIGSTGNMGIGKSTPTTKFDVQGPVRAANYTAATLPSAAGSGAGAICFVTDSTQTLAAGIGAVVSGGGANFVPVYSDGTNWRIY